MELAELRSLPVLEGLSADQLEELAAAGEEVTFQPGDVLFRSGEPASTWWVLLDGTIELVRHVGREDTVLGVMGTAGQWAGGFRGWDPHGVYLATARAATGGRILRVPAEQLGVLAQEWFPLGVHLLKGLVGTVRAIESTARQREALVALGTLAAGLAHEINNPAAAAARTVDALQETTETLMSALRGLAEAGLSADQFVLLDRLRRQLQPPDLAESALALADREEELAEWLVGHGVEGEWLLAAALAAAGADPGWCERVVAAVGGAPLSSALEWVASSASTTTLLAEVKESTQRVSSLVAAVRSYSQLDRASVQRTDLAEGLDSTLTVLGHKLDGVTVVRDYAPDVPRIEAIAGELNQVWTNLIDNALDAMGGGGTLRVSLRRAEGGSVVVEVGDTGPGLAADVLPHAFEPFFTTKEVGRGTGLGLDISRRIVVDRHGGDIAIERRDGETVFRVRLPAGLGR